MILDYDNIFGIGVSKQEDSGWIQANRGVNSRKREYLHAARKIIGWVIIY